MYNCLWHQHVHKSLSLNIIPIRVMGAARFSCGSGSKKTIWSQLMFKLLHNILDSSQQAISIFTDCYLVFCTYSKPPCHGTTTTQLTLHQHQQTHHPPPEYNIIHLTHPQRAYYTCNASNQVANGKVSTILHNQYIVHCSSHLTVCTYPS